MIRINLIGRKVKQKKTGGSYQLLIYAGMLAVAVVVLFLWHQNVTDKLEGTRKKAREAAENVKKLERVKSQWEAWQVEKGDLDRQIGVFNSLQADQIGPVMALQYLSYALTKVPDVPMSAEEAREQEGAGWNPKWDPSRVWLTGFEVKDNTVKIRGQAVDHEDVAEFYRTLESSKIFTSVSPGLQRRNIENKLQVSYVDFEVNTGLSFADTTTAWREAQELRAIRAAKNDGGDTRMSQGAGDNQAATGDDAPATDKNPGNEGVTNE